jgi:hypothetical protein
MGWRSRNTPGGWRLFDLTSCNKIIQGNQQLTNDKGRYHSSCNQGCMLAPFAKIDSVVPFSYSAIAFSIVPEFSIFLTLPS